jgi:hypothetical protein
MLMLQSIAVWREPSKLTSDYWWHIGSRPPCYHFRRIARTCSRGENVMQRRSFFGGAFAGLVGVRGTSSRDRHFISPEVIIIQCFTSSHNRAAANSLPADMNGFGSQSASDDPAGARKGQPPRRDDFPPGCGLTPSKTPSPRTRVTRPQIS